jgi:hypothetical protein
VHFNTPLSVMGQEFANNIDREGFTEAERAKQRGQRTQEFGGMGTLAGRAVDYFTEIGESGEKFNIDELLKRTAGFLPTEELRQHFAGTMAPALLAAENLRRKNTLSEADIRGMKDPQRLKELAGIKRDMILVDDAKITGDLQTKVSGFSAAELEAAYKENVNADIQGMSEDDLRRGLLNSADYQRKHKSSYLDIIKAERGNADKAVLAQSDLEDRAVQRAAGNTAKAGAEDTLAAVDRLQTGLYKGANDDNRRRAVQSVRQVAPDLITSDKQYAAVEAAVFSNTKDAKTDLAKALGFKDVDALEAAKADANNKNSDMLSLLVGLQEANTADLAGRGVQATDPAAKQRTERMTVEAPRVELHADRVEIGQLDTGLEGLNSAIKALEDKKSGGFFSGLLGGAGLTEAEDKKLAELKAQKERIIEESAKPVHSAPEKTESARDTIAQKAAPMKLRNEAAARTLKEQGIELPTNRVGPGLETTITDGVKRVTFHGEELDPEIYDKHLKQVQQEAKTKGKSAQTPPDIDAAISQSQMPRKLDSDAAIQMANWTAAQTRVVQNPPIQLAASASGAAQDTLTLGGRLKLDGLQEAILEATAPRGVSMPSGGPTIVQDNHRPNVT